MLMMTLLLPINSVNQVLLPSQVLLKSCKGVLEKYLSDPKLKFYLLVYTKNHAVSEDLKYKMEKFGRYD